MTSKKVIKNLDDVIGYGEGVLVRYCKKYKLDIAQFKKVHWKMNKRRTRVLGTANKASELITISKSHVDFSSQQAIKNTIRHEIAHIISFKHGSNGHDSAFKVVAKRLKVKETNFSYSRKKWYKFKCTECNTMWKSTRTTLTFCRKCNNSNLTKI